MFLSCGFFLGFCGGRLVLSLSPTNIIGLISHRQTQTDTDGRTIIKRKFYLIMIRWWAWCVFRGRYLDYYRTQHTKTAYRAHSTGRGATTQGRGGKGGGSGRNATRGNQTGTGGKIAPEQDARHRHKKREWLSLSLSSYIKLLQVSVSAVWCGLLFRFRIWCGFHQMLVAFRCAFCILPHAMPILYVSL